MVLLVGLVVVVAITTIAIGLSAVDQTTDSAEVEQAETAMDQFAQGTSSATGGSAAAFPEDGRAYVDADAGWINVSVGDETVLNRSQGRLGALYYESQDGTTLAYQGGGVWRDDGPGQSTVQTPPPIQYGNRSHATLVLPVRTLATDSGSVGGSDVSALETESVFPVEDTDVSNPITDPVTVTVQSEFYEGWGDHLEERFGSEKVTYDHDAQRVTVELEGGEITYETDETDPNETETEYREPVEGMVVNDGSELGVSNELEVDSFDSSEGAYTPAASRAGGDVQTRGDFLPSNAAEFHGDVNATGRAEVSNDVVIHGALVLGTAEDPSTLSAGTIHGPLSIQGDAKLQGDGPHVRDDVYVGGEAEPLAGTFEGDVHLSEGGRVGGGDSQTRIEGSLYAGDDVRLAGVVVEGDVYTTGNVFGGGATVEGNVSEGVSSPSPSSPLDPNVTVSEPDVDIDDRVANASTENDNENATDVKPGQRRLEGCESTCVLTNGTYYLSELDFGKPNEKLVLDTTDGPIDLHVDGRVSVGGGSTIEIVYDEADEYPVRVFSTGDFDFEGGDGKIRIEDDRTTLFEVYMQPSATFRVDEGAVFRGVVFGLSDGDDRTVVDLSGGEGAAIYGAALGDVRNFDQIGEFHYDESLGERAVRRTEPADEPGGEDRRRVLKDADVSYLYLDREPVAVE